MGIPPLHRMRERLLRPFKSFREIRHALWMIGFAFVPPAAVAIVFELSLPEHTIEQMSPIKPPATGGRDFAPILHYYIAWVTHGLVSVGVAFFAARSAFRNTAITKTTVLKRFRIMVFLFTLLIVLIADAAHCNLALLSHERLFNVLSADISLSPLFQQERQIGGYTISCFTVFSIFPVTAIAAAFWAAITIILCASKFLVEFERTDPGLGMDDRVAAFNEAMDELRSHFTALSLVLITSTLTTVAYLRTPLGLLSAVERHSFKTLTDAVGLAWGMTFSLILLALCLYPFGMLRECFDRLSREAQGINHGEVLAGWVRMNRVVLQVPGNLQMVLSVLLPATVAVLAHLVPS